MGLDLAKIPQSALLGFFLFGLAFTAFIGMSQDLGSPIVLDNPFAKNGSINNTFATAQTIQDEIELSGTDTSNTFFPAVDTIFSVWRFMKATMSDLNQAFEIFIYNLGGGSQMVMLAKIFGVLIGLSIAIIVMKMLFKVGGEKIQ